MAPKPPNARRAPAEPWRSSFGRRGWEMAASRYCDAPTRVAARRSRWRSSFGRRGWEMAASRYCDAPTRVAARRSRWRSSFDRRGWEVAACRYCGAPARPGCWRSARGGVGVGVGDLCLSAHLAVVVVSADRAQAGLAAPLARLEVADDRRQGRAQLVGEPRLVVGELAQHLAGGERVNHDREGVAYEASVLLDVRQQLQELRQVAQQPLA